MAKHLFIGSPDTGEPMGHFGELNDFLNSPNAEKSLYELCRTELLLKLEHDAGPTCVPTIAKQTELTINFVVKEMTDEEIANLPEY